MNAEMHTDVQPVPAYVVRREPLDEAPPRVVEYLRQPVPSLPLSVTDSSWRASTGAAVRAVLPWWVVRLLAAWGLVTLASLVGPCSPPAPAPAWAASEATP